MTEDHRPGVQIPAEECILPVGDSWYFRLASLALHVYAMKHVCKPVHQFCYSVEHKVE